MWSADKDFTARGFSTPPPTWKSKRSSPIMPASEKKRLSPQAKDDLFHVVHKVPAGDSPYVRAKHVQLIDKDPSRAISLFWAAINSGDRVDSALKDMAVVMKQLDRSDEAIEAVKSFRHLCPPESQESLDNVLVELYKRSGRIEEQIEMLQVKLKQIEEGVAFGGRRTKTARSQGKKIQVTIEQEYSRLLGNLAWAYLQQDNYKSAEELYRKALSIEPDKNKQCNLAICLIHMKRTTEAKFLLQAIRAQPQDEHVNEAYAKSFERAVQVLTELESESVAMPSAREEENHIETLTSLSSFINRSSKETSSSVNGGQNDASNFVVSTKLMDGHEETVLLNETNRRSHIQKQNKSNSKIVCFGKDNSEWTSFGLGNCSESSSISSFVEKLKGWNPESQYKRTDFASKGGKNKWFKSKTYGQQVGNSTGKKVYASPHFGREIPKIPFTQPRRSAWSNNRNQRTLAADDMVGGCSRKLLFDQPTASENAQSLTNQNLGRQLPASTDGLLEGSETCSPSSTNQDGRMLQGVHAEVNRESVLQPIVNGDWNMNYWAQENGQKKLANIEVIPAMELAVASGNHLTVRETSSGGDRDRSFKTTIAGSVRLTEMVEPISEYMKTTQKLQSQCEPTTRILEHPQEFFISKSKKSWADMVEEDEQELLTGKSEFPENKWVYLSQDSTNSFRTPRKCSDDWHGSEFNDENMNSNIIHQTCSPADQIENISQKIESFNLKVGYYTQPQNDDVSSMNQPARRSLCFDQHQKPNIAENFCASPLPNKTLDFEGHNAWLANDRECTSGNGIRLMRRNRLQVFQDITLFPESPRP